MDDGLQRKYPCSRRADYWPASVTILDRNIKHESIPSIFAFDLDVRRYRITPIRGVISGKSTRRINQLRCTDWVRVPICERAVIPREKSSELPSLIPATSTNGHAHEDETFDLKKPLLERHVSARESRMGSDDLTMLVWTNEKIHQINPLGWVATKFGMEDTRSSPLFGLEQLQLESRTGERFPGGYTLVTHLKSNQIFLLVR